MEYTNNTNKTQYVVQWNDDDAVAVTLPPNYCIPSLAGYVIEVFYDYFEADDFVQRKFLLAIDEL